MSTPEPVHLSSSAISQLPQETFTSKDHPGFPKQSLAWQSLFSSPSTSTNSLTSGLLTLPPAPKGRLALHRHSQAEMYYILAGQGTVTISGKEHHVGPGDALFIPGDAEHGTVNTGQEEMRWLYVFATDSFRDVVYRYSSPNGEDSLTWTSEM